MAASEGIAKRATIDVGFTDTSFIDNMERFNRLLKGANEQVSRFHDVLDHTDQSLSEFGQHMNLFADRNDETMNRIRQHTNDTAKSTERLNETSRRFADTYNNYKDKVIADNDQMNESERKRYQNAINNEHGINESLSRILTHYRRNDDEMANNLKSKMNGVGRTSSHVSDRVASANGRVGRSFHVANNGIDRHIQSVRNAQSRDYRWLRTAQAMSLTTLGLGASLYKGAKDVGTLQQAYLHAGNMAHYGGEKMSRVQHDINQQWRVGSQLSVKYGISQDQIAKGYQALVARGYTTNESLHTQKSLLQAAIASGDNYNDVVKDSTNVLDAYNMRSQNAATMTDNTRKVVNEMAYAADQTATNFQGLGVGMSYVAATAHTTHQSISETSSALGILSNKGMQASQAGVGLRKVLNSFLSVNQKGQQAQVMKQLGLTEQDFKTSSGHLKSLGSLMTLLNNKTKNMDSQERGAVFHRFFGATGQEAALNLASDTKGLSHLNDQVERSQNMGRNHQGYVALLSAHNMKSAQNQFNIFKQAWQAFMVTSAREILPEFTDALKHADVYIAKLNNLSPRAKKWTIFGALAVAAISPISYAIFGIQSAFHGVELTLLHVRHLFAKPISNAMTHSADKQAGQQEKDALEDTKSAKSITGLTKDGTKYGVLAKNLPDVSVAGATTLALGMGTFMGLNANHEAGKQIHDRLKRQFNSPIQQRITTELDKASVNRSLEGNKRFTKQMRQQDNSISTNIEKQLYKASENNEKSSEKNIHTLLRYGAINQRQAHKLLKNAQNTNFNRYTSAKRTITHINNAELEGHKVNQRDFKRAAKAMNRIIAGNGHNQTQLFKRLQNANGKISTKTASTLLRNSYKSYKAQTNNANKTYHSAKNAAWKRYNAVTRAAEDEYGKNSSLYKKIKANSAKIRKNTIHDAYERKYWSVYYAKQEHDRTISEAEKQHRGLNKEVDLTTGHIKTEWSETESTLGRIGRGIENIFDGIGDAMNKVTGGFAHKLSTAADSAGEFGKTRTATHATGGAISHTEMSLVNEKGQESAYNPIKNTFRLLGNNGPQVLKLYAGEHVLDAQDTHELLNGGLGRGVTLPGYANGTDTIHGLIHGYAMGTGRAGAISSEEASNPKWMQDIDSNLFKSGISYSPASVLNIPNDVISNFHHPLKAIGSSLLDLPDAKAMKGTKLAKPLKKLKNSSLFKHLAAPGADITGNLLDKIPVHHFGAKLGKLLDPDALNRNFRKIKPMMHNIIGYGKTFGKQMLKGPIVKGYHSLMHNIPKWSNRIWRGAKRTGRIALRGIRSFGHSALRGTRQIGSRAWRDIKRFGRGTMRFGRRMFRGGRRLLNRAGHGIARFSRRTWSSAKRLGRRLWSGTKHVALRMWNSAKRTGRNIWSNTKRIARNVGRTAHSLWNRTKAGASRTWSRVVSGARRMASRIGRTTSRLFHEAISKGRSAWSTIKSGAASAVSHAKSMIDGLKSAASEAASWIESKLSHIHMPHFAAGGPIRRSTMALVGEHGPETAYNARTGMVRMLGMNGPQITMLLAGEQVLTNTQTNRLLHGGLGRGTRLPAYSRGTNARLSGPASRSSVFNIVGMFNGKHALNDMRYFNKHAKAIWDDVSSHITDGSHDMSRDVTKTNSDLSDTTRDIFKEMSKKVNDLTDDLKSGLIQAAHDMAEGFGDKFKKLITYAKEDMESVIDKLNRGVTGIDRALRAFGGNSHVIHPIHYATGTMNGRIAYDQLGILNDAISGPRQEAVVRGGNLLFPQGDNVPVPLQKGDAVLNGNQTKQLINNTTVNHYAKGSGFHLSGKLIKDITKTLGLALKGPKKFFSKVFDHVMGSPSGHQLSKGIDELSAKALNPLGDRWTKAMFNYIKSLLTPDNDTGGSSGSVLLNEMHKLGDGHTYLWGASGPDHYDCGGLVMAALHHLGMPSEHTIYPYPRIPARDATTGDIVQSATHVGVVADPHARTYFSAYGPNLAKDSIKTQPLTNEYFTPGHPYYFRRPWKLYREDQRNMGKDSKSHKNNNGLMKLVKRELGSSATNWLKKAASIISDGSGSATNQPNPGGSSIRRFIPEIRTAAATMHAHLTPRLINLLLGTIFNESGGRPDASNDYDVNAGPNHSVGLLQYTADTWNAYALPGHRDRTNAYDNFLTYFNNSQYASALVGYDSANGKSGGEWNPAHGSGPGGSRRFSRIPAANGGWADQYNMRIFGEAGPEVAINPRRSTADRYIVEAINARMHDNPNSPIANLLHSIIIRKHSGNLRNAISGLMNKVTNAKPSSHRKSINININFGDIVVNSNGGNINTGAFANKIKRAAKQAIMKAAYESATKLD